MEINKLIKEELQGLLKEGYVMEHDNFKFRQKVEKSQFYKFQGFSNDYDVDITESDIYITWQIGFWLNDMGVENFIVRIIGVDGTYDVKMYDKQSDEESQDDNKNIAETSWKFQFDEATLYLNSSLYINSLDFDFETKICDVEFYDKNTDY